MLRMATATLPLVLIAGGAIALVPSNVDPAHKFAWGENVGWTNWRGEAEPGQGVVVHATFLEGFIWGENVGWINVGDGTPEADCEGRPCYANLDGADFGVNVDPATGEMSGLAWGENILWVNFEGGAPPSGRWGQEKLRRT